MKPIIGITGNFIDRDRFFVDAGIGTKGQEWSVLPNDYIKAVVRAGGVPLIIPVETDREILIEIGELIDGLILSGGEDVDPMIYGSIPDDKTGRISPDRDDYELFLTDYIYKKTKKPILAVCRGLQILNVYLGGKLILDIPRAGYNTHSISVNERYNPVHKVRIEEDSLLYNIINKSELGVNSHHHQGISQLGRDLRIIAKAEDGLIEAVEHKDIEDRFIMGLQWHPEMLCLSDEGQYKIFDYFINEARDIKKQQ